MSQSVFEPTLDDIATRVCDHYQILKQQYPKEKTTVLFLRAVGHFYNVWAKKRGYTLKEFKSSIGRIVQSRKKTGKIKLFKELTEEEQEEFEIWKLLNQSKEQSYV